MPLKVFEALTIEAVTASSRCPYCFSEEQPPDKVVPGGKANKNGPWIDRHLRRCKKKAIHIQACEKLKQERAKWGVHDDCGRVMILDLRDGLALIENDSRRYVVPAGDLTVGNVGAILEIIKKMNIPEDELLTVIRHLQAEAKEMGVFASTLARGARVEFKHQDKIHIGIVLRSHGKKRVIVKCEDVEIPAMNIKADEILRIVE